MRISHGMLVLALGVVGRNVVAQTPPVVYGVVTTAYGGAIPGAEVLIGNSTLRAITSDSGTFMLQSTPTGRLHITVRRLGFRPAEKTVDLGATDAKELNFELEAVAEKLDSIIIAGRGANPRMTEFWNRRSAGVGAFVTREDIDRRRPYRPSDLLRTISGVRVGKDDLNGQPRIAMGRSPGAQVLGATCDVNYYMDGNWMAPGTFHLDDLSSAEIEAIEIYRGPSETPTRFKQRETACGLIAIWTREPPRRAPPPP